MQEQLELLNLAHDAIVAHDMNDRITFWNRGAEALYGYSAQEAIGQPIHRMTQSNSPVPHAQIRTELLRSGRWDGEITRVRHDGGEIVIASRAALLRDANGLPRAVLATSNDITQRKRMEAELQRQRDALKRSEAFLLDAQRLSRTGSIATRLPAGTMWWSDEAYRIFDYPRDVEPSIDAILACTHPDDIGIVRGAHESAIGGACDIDVEHRLLLPDGSVKHVHFVAHRASTEADGDEYVGALMDVTDTKLAQEALARSTAELAHVTRVTMLGELAASIAHEVTQPMAAIVTNGDAGLRWLNRAQPDIAEAQQSITQIIRDAKRASEVIARIRAMARKRDSQPATLDVNEIVGETIELVRRELGRHRVDVRTELATPSPTVQCDRVQLQQVLINLFMNAAQAMSGVNGPRVLRIATGESQSDEGYAQITVQDSGTGISVDNARRLFDAFFTTKAEGMGMGLSICRSIIEAHGGRIWAESPEEGGARLRFVLPENQGGDDEH
jgi:PAS domain S-box-containing protein